jgi:hypothetical protein
LACVEASPSLARRGWSLEPVRLAEKGELQGAGDRPLSDEQMVLARVKTLGQLTSALQVEQRAPEVPNSLTLAEVRAAPGDG